MLQHKVGFNPHFTKRITQLTHSIEHYHKYIENLTLAEFCLSFEKIDIDADKLHNELVNAINVHEQFISQRALLIEYYKIHYSPKN